MSVPVMGQGQRIGGPFGQAMFQGKLPPPGAATVVGRSFVYSVHNGFGDSLALLVAADEKKVRDELGLTDDEANQLRLLKGQILFNTPKYASRFKSMTEADQEGVQAELMRDMQRVAEQVNRIATPERKEKTQKLVFQILGGLDNPMVNPAMLDTLHLSPEQKKKADATFEEMKEERIAMLEESLQLAEKMITLGGPNMSPEDRAKMEEERKVLEAKIFAMGKKLGSRLREHLTLEQREQEKNLIASRPLFLPKLPRPMREASPEMYVPGSDSWQPGRGAPKQNDEENQPNKQRKKFPTTE
jgi:hypothetical protein